MKKALLIFLFVIAVLLLINIEMISYGLSQGKGQLHLITHTQPVKKLLNEKGFPDSLKQKINLVQEAKIFAEKELGLKKTANYSSYYEQNGLPILWIVSACPPFEMKEYKWHFPILGNLGYKGFFDKNKAVAAANKLKKQGYDIDVGEVNAWSTLGWLKDPILSSMLSKTDGELARLIIHELTHTTVYISNAAQLNENLATFIGDSGAKLFIKKRFGKNSKELQEYQNHLSDIEQLANHLLRGANQLEKLYKTNGFKEKKIEEKRVLKRNLINEIMNQLDSISFSQPNQFTHLKSSSFKPNNTFFITYKMYRGQQEKLKQQFEKDFQSDYVQFMEFWKKQ